MAGPNIVLPQAGDEVTATWGQSVAGALNGLQSGTGTIPAAPGGSGTLVVTFPKAYVSAPVVMVSGQGSGVASAQPLSVNAVTATTCTLGYRHRSDAAGLACPVAWLAMGTLA